MYGLCDCNNFFVSCERVFDPSAENKPVVVLSSNDGCVISRSNEAKALGIKMGQPFFQIKELVDSKKVKIFSSNMVLYGDMSKRVMSVLRENSPSIEVYSIDEAFIDLSGVDVSTLKSWGESVALKIKKATGIPVSIGIAQTKTLAKIAAKLCKKYTKLNGACVMSDKKDVTKVLKTVEISDVWGIGRRYTQMLRLAAVATAYNFTECSEMWVRSKMGIVGYRTWAELRGVAMIKFDDVLEPKKQILNSRSFSKDIADFNQIHGHVSMFASMCAEKLRAQGSVAQRVTVFICTNRHREDKPQLYDSISETLTVATDCSMEIVSVATKILKKVYKEGYGYKKAGVSVTMICQKEQRSYDLFDEKDRSKQSKLMSVLDGINKSHNRRIVAVASAASCVNVNKKYLSKCYTTDWSDILMVKV